MQDWYRPPPRFQEERPPASMPSHPGDPRFYPGTPAHAGSSFLINQVADALTHVMMMRRGSQQQQNKRGKWD